MLDLIWLVPAIPFCSALVLAVFGSRFTRKGVAVLGAGAIAASSVISFLIAVSFLRNPPSGGAFIEVQGTAEGHAFRRHELDALLNLAASGIGQLFELQMQALKGP